MPIYGGNLQLKVATLFWTICSDRQRYYYLIVNDTMIYRISKPKMIRNDVECVASIKTHITRFKFVNIDYQINFEYLFII